MAAPLEACTREEQRSVIRFLGSEGVNPIEIHRRMKMQYGDACLSLWQVYNCINIPNCEVLSQIIMEIWKASSSPIRSEI